MKNLPTIPQKPHIDVQDQASLALATSYLSQLNKSLDTLTAHKEAKTKPINEALRKIRADYKPLEEKLTQAIAEIKQSITAYATKQAKIALDEEKRILADKRTNITTKIQQLAEIPQGTPEKVATQEGAITFTTTKKYAITPNITGEQALALLKVNALTLDIPTLKAHIKTTGTTPAGIEITEEQTLRNYR